MKKIVCLILAINLFLCFAACSEKQNTAYEISSESDIGKNYNSNELRSQYYTSVVFESVEDICEYSDAVVSAELTEIENFDYAVNCYTFEVITDYFGTAEDVIHVYDDVSTYYELGGVYYLFCDRWESDLYPHVVYSRYCNEFLPREYSLAGEIIYDFRDGYSLGLEFASDIHSIVQTYASTAGSLQTAGITSASLSAAEAVNMADLVIAVTITEVEPMNIYVSKASYVIDDVIMGGVSEDGANLHVPPDTEVGDRLLLLLKLNGSSYEAVSQEYGILAYGSSEASAVLNMIE